MQKNLKNGNIYLIVAFVMMGILFYSSSQTYEQQSSIPVLEKILKNEPFKEALSGVSFMYGDSPVSIKDSGYFKFVEFFIRKAAHFGTYFILGSSLFMALIPRIKHLGLALLYAWLAATGYAALDEFHQMLTGGRSPMFEDVVLDSSGALFACFICIFFFWFSNRKKPKKRK